MQKTMLPLVKSQYPAEELDKHRLVKLDAHCNLIPNDGVGSIVNFIAWAESAEIKLWLAS